MKAYKLDYLSYGKYDKINPTFWVKLCMPEPHIQKLDIEWVGDYVDTEKSIGWMLALRTRMFINYRNLAFYKKKTKKHQQQQNHRSKPRPINYIKN